MAACAKDRSLRQLLQVERISNAGAAEGCALLLLYLQKEYKNEI
jgi:hypothetical protein